jgi:hypothetical protein
MRKLRFGMLSIAKYTQFQNWNSGAGPLKPVGRQAICPQREQALASLPVLWRKGMVCNAIKDVGAGFEEVAHADDLKNASCF